MYWGYDRSLSSITDTIKQYNIEINRECICDDLTSKYLQEKASIKINIKIDSYDMILDLLYSLKQAESKNLIVSLLNEQLQGIENEQILKIEQKYLDEYEEIIQVVEQGDTNA